MTHVSPEVQNFGPQADEPSGTGPASKPESGGGLASIEMTSKGPPSNEMTSNGGVTSKEMTSEGPPSTGRMHLVPSQPGAGTLPHVQAPPTQVARPEGSCPQHWESSSPKQSGADPLHDGEASAQSAVPLHPTTFPPPHVHVPAEQVAATEEAVEQHWRGLLS
jgi:hypothetical protein